MIATLEDDRRTRAVLDDSNGYARNAPSVVMRRMRDHDEADLLAVAVRVESDKGA
jgi:hypothetical protein